MAANCLTEILLSFVTSDMTKATVFVPEVLEYVSGATRRHDAPRSPERVTMLGCRTIQYHHNQEGNGHRHGNNSREPVQSLYTRVFQTARVSPSPSFESGLSPLVHELTCYESRGAVA
jgi:hypothetical protein